MHQTLTEIKAMLASRGLRPKKRLGQHFLHDANQMSRLVSAADVRPGDVVLEVGAGTGGLSVRLLAGGARLIAVEIDRDLEPILQEVCRPHGDRAVLVVGDILNGKHRLSARVAEALADQLRSAGATTFKCVANLPYNAASPVLVNLVADQPAMQQAVVTVQREVADRLAAEPGGKDYGALGVMVQAMCAVRVVGAVSPSCFWPRPAVASAIVKLMRRSEPMCDDPARLGRLLQRLFSQRRKQLGHILGRQAKLPEGVSLAMRPEELTVEQFVMLSRQLA